MAVYWLVQNLKGEKRPELEVVDIEMVAAAAADFADDVEGKTVYEELEQRLVVGAEPQVVLELYFEAVEKRLEAEQRSADVHVVGMVMIYEYSILLP